MKRQSIKVLPILFVCVVLFVSVLSVPASAQTPNINNSNRWHTACSQYDIYATASFSGTVLQTVNKGSNRQSNDLTSGNYKYVDSNGNFIWNTIKTSSGTGGYTRSNKICPSDRCYRVTATTLYIRSQPVAGSSVVCTVSSGVYVQIISVVGGSDMSYVRVRTGSNVGKTGYIIDNSYITQVNG